MRIAAVLLALALSVPGGALAHEHIAIGGCRVHPPVRLGERHERDQRFAIHTDDRSATLLVTGHVVAFQLSDRTMREVDRELRHERDQDEDCWLADVIKSAVLGGVRDMLDHSLECPLRELRDVRYRDGRLELIARDGDHIFEDLEVDDEPVLESFSPADAQAFVVEFHRARGR